MVLLVKQTIQAVSRALHLLIQQVFEALLAVEVLFASCFPNFKLVCQFATAAQ